MDERELIERAVAGDTAAERALYEQHVGRVYRMAYRMTGDEALAEDFTQEVFVKAFAKLGGFEFRSRLSTWLHSITMSVVLNGLRRVKREREREQGHEDLEQVAGGVPDPDRTLRLALHQAVDTLGDGMRAVLVLHDVEGYTHGEIATALGVEEGTSKARLSRARARLREVLVEMGLHAPRFPQNAPRAEGGGS